MLFFVKVKSHKYLFLNKNRKKSSKIWQNSKYIYYNITSRDHSYDILTTRNRARWISHTIGYEIILRVWFVFHPRRGTLTIFSAWSLSSIYGISLDRYNKKLFPYRSSFFMFFFISISSYDVLSIWFLGKTY